MRFVVKAPEMLPDLMPQVLDALQGRRKVALYGEMGAGKTTFVRAFCQYLGVDGNPSSPTYSLVNEYAYTAPDGSTALFHHLDLYRLRNTREALDIGLEELLDDPWYCFIEWPELVEALFGEDVVRMRLEIVGEQERALWIAVSDQDASNFAQSSGSSNPEQSQKP